MLILSIYSIYHLFLYHAALSGSVVSDSLQPCGL